MSVSVVFDNSIFAFSAASLRRCIAVASSFKSIPSFFLNSFIIKFIKALSISVPPSCVSPEVDLTSNTPSPNSIIVTSKVPPPKSNTNILISFSDLSRP